MVINSRIISSLEKVFLDSSLNCFKTLDRLTVLRGERVSFQIASEIIYEEGESCRNSRISLKPVVKGPLSELVSIRRVANVPVELAVYKGLGDDNYLRTEPGLYPDVLSPLMYDGSVILTSAGSSAVWCELTVPTDFPAGDAEITVEYLQGENIKSTCTLTLEVISATLSEQTMYLTQWFHCDSLAHYYRVEPWSEEHWRIVENFARVAVKNGINLLLTPTFTPALDTAVGRERLTTQLVGVTVTNGEYSFDFSLLDRWIDMCDRVGVKYFEIAHFFTQWGAKCAPKVMATVDGEYKRIFGWDTSATGAEYSSFLRLFVTSFLEHMKARGDDKRCLFHISDEPNTDNLEFYRAAKAVVADLLEGYTIMDALSNYDFYAQGILSTPIPSNNHIKPFLDNNVPNLWTYYCCGQFNKVSNRLIAMPSWRNRCIGMQFFRFDIVGFLQWGYNFYNNMLSHDAINPYMDTSAAGAFPAGDAFSVYPGADGDALESLRIVVFHEALQDYSAMKLCAELYSKEEVVAEIEAILGDEISFENCPTEAATVLAIRERINRMIKAKLQ